MPSQYLLGRLASPLATPAAAHTALADLTQQAQLQRLPEKANALVMLVRELSPFLFGDDGAPGFSLDLAAALARGALPNLRDGDDARKAARLIVLLLVEVVGRRAPALLASDDNGWQRIDAACAALLEDASGGHSVYAPRRVVALRSLGTLIGASSSPAAAAERAHKVRTRTYVSERAAAVQYLNFDPIPLVYPTYSPIRRCARWSPTPRKPFCSGAAGGN